MTISPLGTGLFTAKRAPLRILLAIAFGLDSNRIVGKPAWLDDEAYDISAEADEGVTPTRPQLQQMLQALLADRLHLVAHREENQVNGYALLVSKAGARLQQSKAGPGAVYLFAESIRAQGISAATLAGLLAHPLKTPVADKTGLTGSYDVVLTFAAASATDSALPSIFTAVREQLGLELRPDKLAIQTLVVDSVEKEPTAN